MNTNHTTGSSKKKDTLFSDYKDLMDINGMIEILGIGKNAAYNLLRSKQIKAFQIAGKWRITKQSVIDFIERQNDAADSH